MSTASTAAPDAAGAAELALSLPRQLRLAGLEVPVSAATAFAEALDVLGPTGLSDLYWAGRATLVRRPEELPTFDDAFATLLAASAGPPVQPEPAAPEVDLVVEPAEDDAGDPAVDGASDEDRRQVRFSATEQLRHADFAELGDDDAVAALLDQLPVRPSLRRSRRRRPDRRGRGPVDVRRTATRAMRTHGELMDRVGTRRRVQSRRLVLLLDVSGSMEPYARALLRVAHVASHRIDRVEVFAMGTRLTRLTRSLAARDGDAALDAAAGAIPDWAGGTRLGESIGAFADGWGVAGMARGATVVVLSDGWDRGDPELLGEQLGRLARVAHRVVWVNPLKATEGYAPLAGGMAAALPHVDDFIAGHSVAALDHLVEAIAR